MKITLRLNRAITPNEEITLTEGMKVFSKHFEDCGMAGTEIHAYPNIVIESRDDLVRTLATQFVNESEVKKNKKKIKKRGRSTTTTKT